MSLSVSREKDGSGTTKANAIFGEVSATTNHIRLNGKSIHTWIVDTGASIHVCCDDSLFDNCCSIHPVAVGLSNGSSLEAIKVGSVKINNDLVLTNVFYVPTFNCNLISISQLLSTRQLSILFTNLECVI